MIGGIKVPKCLECTSYRITAVRGFEKHWCYNRKVLSNSIGRTIRSDNLNPSPKWCPIVVYGLGDRYYSSGGL